MQLDIQSLCVVRSHKPLLQEITFSAHAGEFIGLVGPNGAGKSTLLATLAGLLPFQGVISYGDSAIDRLQGADKAKTLSYLPQEREINWAVPAEKIVSLGLEATRSPWAPRRADEHDRIAAALEKMRLSNLAERNAKTLSGGEKARLLAARTLVQDARALLADEPIAGLDPAHQFILMQELASLAQNNKLVIASLHDLQMAARWCSRLIVLHHGKIFADGKPVEIITPALLRAVYAIEAEIIKAGDHSMTIETIGLSQY